MTSGWTSYGHPLDRRPEHYVGSLSQDEERPPEGEQLAEAKSAPGKVGWINVYQRANGDQLVLPLLGIHPRTRVGRHDAVAGRSIVVADRVSAEGDGADGLTPPAPTA